MKKVGFAVFSAILLVALVSCVTHLDQPYRRLTGGAIREAEASFSRARVYTARGDFHRAITEYTRGLATLPNSILALTNRGMAHSAMANWDMAIADFSCIAIPVLEKRSSVAPSLGSSARGGLEGFFIHTERTYVEAML